MLFKGWQALGLPFRVRSSTGPAFAVTSEQEGEHTISDCDAGRDRSRWLGGPE